MKKGYIAAFLAYFWWGLSPVYWKLISSIPELEILGVRVLLSLPALLVILMFTKKMTAFKNELTQITKIKPYILSAFLLATNWYIFIWAMNNNHIVEASLGYFINPLVNVLLGVVLLKEKMLRLQWLAILLAFGGVMYLAVNYGHFPWISLILAITFAYYGFIRKTGALGPLIGLTTEMLVLLIPALVLLLYLATGTNIVIPSLTWDMHFLLSLTAVITIVPLVVFAYGARKIPYSTLGLIQYIAPTLQFLIGVFLYNEEFNTERLIGFSFIWLALIVYSFESIYRIRRKNKKAFQGLKP